MDTRSCDYVVDPAARSRLVAVSETSEPCTTHVTSDASDATKTPSSAANRTSPMDVGAVLPPDGSNLNTDAGLCGTSPRSEFSSEFEEYFESMQQQHQHQTQSAVTLAENGGPPKQCAPVVQSFVGILVTQSFHDGCQAAVDLLPKVETFSCCQPNNLVKPTAVRPMGCDLSFACCQGAGRVAGRATDDPVNSDCGGVDGACVHRASQVDDVAEFASSLLRETYDSAVLNVQERLDGRPNPPGLVDHAFRDAVTAHVVQRRRRTLSEGVTGGRGDGHADAATVLCDGAVPSFFDECLSDEMKVKLMEMVASQQSHMHRQSGSAADAPRMSGGGDAQALSGGVVSRRAHATRGAHRWRDDGDTANAHAAAHWNLPAIRIYSEDADLTETIDLTVAASDESRGPVVVRRASPDGAHNQRCSCPHCVCSVDGYVDVMIDDVLTETYDAIMENQCDEAKEQFARCTFRSLDGAAEPDLHRFAGRLVHLAMRDAMRLLRRASKHGKRCRHQSQNRASPRVEVAADSRYFEREFSHDLRRLSPRKSSLVPSSERSNIDVRRCSLDETRSLQLSNQCSSFHDVVLSDFEDELRNSLVRSPNLHLFESDDGDALLQHRTQRRASEPIHSLKRDSISESAPCAAVPATDVTCQNPAATSTEVVLGWLNATNWGGHHHHHHHHPREQRLKSLATLASPLERYVDDVITQVFNAAYLELFDRDLRVAAPRRMKAVDESRTVCDTKLFTRLWHGPRAAHCSPPGGVGSNSNMKLLMCSYFPTPAPFHSLNVMAAVMAGHIVRDAVRAVSTQHRREEVGVVLLVRKPIFVRAVCLSTGVSLSHSLSLSLTRLFLSPVSVLSNIYQ